VNPSSDIGVQVGLVMAAAKVPETFAPGLSSRSVLDQGIATGLSTGVHYLLSLGTQDALQALAAELAQTRVAARRIPPANRERTATVLVDLAAIPAGLALGALLPSHPGEAMVRGALRQAGWRAAVTGVGAVSLMATRSAARELDSVVGANGRVASFPVAVPVGLAIAFLVDRRSTALAAVDQPRAPDSPPLMRSLLVATGVEGGLATAAYAEHFFAEALGERLSSMLPGGTQVWRLAAHGASLGLLAVGVSSLWTRAMERIEAGSAIEEPLFGDPDASRWTGPTLSGGPGSLVPWTTLGREGRRHMVTYVRPQPLAHRPAGLPDLSIQTVMRETATAAPVQVYVGLDSAPTARERVDLALAEMDRTRAFDRSLIMLVSPTGTGYVNYVAVAAAQYLTRGDMASVTLQYSKRPSPLSLGKVSQAREQNRLLWLKILERLQGVHGQRRPRVVLFGESLGAHTSQDVFLHWGTLGPQALGIDRALWIGTPYGSGWMHEVTGPDRLDVDKDTIAVVNDFRQLEALGEERRARLRYVMLSHDNDGVAKFGLDLLTTRPRWLGPDRPPPVVVDGASPRGIDPRLRWRPVTTFVHTLIDVKNAQLPGVYRAWGHDYRPDLPRFISEVYGLPATPDQLDRIADAVKQRDTLREQLLDQATPVSPD
jgi:uncharacterized membrane protein